MTLRLSEEDQRALEQLAKEEGVSLQVAAIRAIHEAKVASASQRVRNKYADVLDRLGQ